MIVISNFSSFAAKECDIEFVDPSAFVPPEADGIAGKNGCSWDEDPYEKLVRGNLQLLDKQKVRSKQWQEEHDNQAIYSRLFSSWVMHTGSFFCSKVAYFTFVLS